jgi:exodeoxyribonuclease VIII
VRPREYPVRFSNLKTLARSPAHYLYNLTHPRPDSVSLRMGRLVDLLIFEQAIPVIYDGSRRGKEWKAFEAEHDGEDIFTRSEFDSAREIAESFARPEHSEALRLLGSGERQKRLTWDWLGRVCSGTPDAFGEYLVDLKTTRCAQPGAFKRDAIRYAYHAQLAWYRNGMIRSGLQPPAQCYIVAVETSAPFPITVHRLTEQAIDMGERLCRVWMEQLLACERADHWPGYCESFVDFDIETELELTFGDEEAA